MADWGRPSTGGGSGLERAVPRSLEAEQAVLGAMLLSADALVRGLDLLRADDFYHDVHRQVFEAMGELSAGNTAADLITLTDAMRAKGRLGDIGGATYLSQLASSTPTAANLEYHARIVEEKSLLRSLIRVSNRLLDRGYAGQDEVAQLIDEAGEMILDLQGRSARKSYSSLREILLEFYDRLEHLSARGTGITGVSSGFFDLDSLTSGFQPADLVVVAARPSMGKTAFCLNVAAHAARRGKVPVAFFSLEMSKESLGARLLSLETGIDLMHLRTGRLTTEDWQRVVAGMGQLAEAPILIDDTPNLSVVELRARARRMRLEHELGLVVVDYLQLMRGHGREDGRQQEIAAISRGMKALARELQVPVLALSQLSRAVEHRQDRRPQLSDLRESGCLTGETLVDMADTGERMFLRDLVEKVGFAVWALNPDTNRLERAVVSRAFSTGVKPVYRLNTRLGRTLQATANHRFLTPGGWKRLDELGVGDFLALPRQISSTRRLAWGRHKPIGGWVDRLVPKRLFKQPSSAMAQFLLRRRGFYGKVKRVGQGKKGRDQFHGFFLSGRGDLLRYGEQVGAVGHYKAQSLPSAMVSMEERLEDINRDALPGEVWLKYPRSGMIDSAYTGIGIFKQGLSRQRGRRIAQRVDSVGLRRLVQSDIYWDTVASIEPSGEEEVFDLTVPGTHNFVANEIIVHNSIEQDADVVAFIYRDEYYNADTEAPGMAEIIVAKQRNGPTGTVELAFQKELGRFTNLERRYEE